MVVTIVKSSEQFQLCAKHEMRRIGKKTPAHSWTLVRFSLLQPKTFADLLYSLPFVDSYLNKNAL